MIWTQNLFNGRGRRNMLSLSRMAVILTLFAASFGAAAGATAAAKRSNGDVPATALMQAARAKLPATSADLASAVGRWQADSARWGGAGPGSPALERANTLLAGVGRERDSLNAFPTSQGMVCFEIKAAGTCGRLDTETGLTWAILSTHRSTRIYGVAADSVQRVEVTVNGVAHPAVLRNNGYFYELEAGIPESAIDAIVAAWSDGSTRHLDMPW